MEKTIRTTSRMNNQIEGSSATTTRINHGYTAPILNPNSLAYPVTLLSLIAAGARATFTDTTYTARELRHQYSDSRAHLISAARDMVPIVLEMFEMLGSGKEATKRRIVSCESRMYSRIQ